MLMAEYDYEMDIAVQREEAYQDGVEEGELKSTIRPIVKKLKKGYTAEKIADDLEESLENIQRLIAVVKKYAPEYNENAILDEILKLKND